MRILCPIQFSPVTLIEGWSKHARLVPLCAVLTFHYLFSSTYVINYECFWGELWNVIVDPTEE